VIAFLAQAPVDQPQQWMIAGAQLLTFAGLATIVIKWFMGEHRDGQKKQIEEFNLLKQAFVDEVSALKEAFDQLKRDYALALAEHQRDRTIAFAEHQKGITSAFVEMSRENAKMLEALRASNYRLANAQLLLVVALKHADALHKDAKDMIKENDNEFVRTRAPNQQ
jgi:hypothetical protein